MLLLQTHTDRRVIDNLPANGMILPLAERMCGGYGQGRRGMQYMVGYAMETQIQASSKNLKGNIAVLFAVWTSQGTEEISLGCLRPVQGIG